MFHRLGCLIAIATCLVCAVLRADDTVTLRYKFTKGDCQAYRVRTGLKQSTSLMNTKFETTMDQESVGTRTVESIDDKGNALLTIKSEWLKVKMKVGPAGEFEFDSRSTEAPDQTSDLGRNLLPVYEKIATARYQAVVSPRGEVKEIKGYADLMADVIKNNPVGAQFAGGASDDAAKLGLQQLFMILDEGPVKPGDKWEAPIDFNLAKLVKGKAKLTFTYMGPEKLAERTVAKVLALDETSLDIDSETDGTKVTGTFATSQSEGTILFDNATGRIVSSKNSVTMGGQLTAVANDMNFPLQIEQTQTTALELLDEVPK